MHVCMHILNVPNIIPRHPDNIFSPPFLFRLNHGCRLEIISMGTEVTLDGGSLLSMSYLTLFTSHTYLPFLLLFLPLPLFFSLSPRLLPSYDRMTKLHFTAVLFITLKRIGNAGATLITICIPLLLFSVSFTHTLSLTPLS